MLRFDSVNDLPENLREQARKKLGLTGEGPKEAGTSGKSKYRNRKCVVCGVSFDSEMEGRRYLVLRDMKALYEKYGICVDIVEA